MSHHGLHRYPTAHETEAFDLALAQERAHDVCCQRWIHFHRIDVLLLKERRNTLPVSKIDDGQKDPCAIYPYVESAFLTYV